MEKRVLILSASPRKGGNSDTLCDRFKAGAEAAGHQVEKVFLREKKIGYCLGCGACSERGEPCPQKDDMADILQGMIDADVIVLATPVYFYTMDGQLKTLIDRTCARYEEIKDKDFYYIIAAAEEDQTAMEPTLDGFRAFLSCLEGAKEKGTVYGVGAWRIGDIKGTPAMDAAYQMGKAI